MRKLIPWVALFLSIAALMLSFANMLERSAAKPVEAKAPDIQYVMYLGTNDKDTYAPVFAPDEAKTQLDAVLSRHFSGWTVQEANGGWTNDDGSISHEYTLVIYLSDTTRDKVRTAADELLKVFNQSSVLIQANETTTEFYSGK